MNPAAIPGLIALGPPATAEAIAAADDGLLGYLSEEYAAFLALADGVSADTFTLYSCAELPERNETYMVRTYSTGYAAIGDDNGGRAIVMRGGPGPSPVLVVDHGSMQPPDMIQVADSLAGWLAAGCPLHADG